MNEIKVEYCELDNCPKCGNCGERIYVDGAHVWTCQQQYGHDGDHDRSID